MSTEFKQLERVNRDGALRLQRIENQVRNDASRRIQEVRQQAELNAHKQIKQIREQNAQRERRIIEKLKTHTNNRFAQQDAKYREALLGVSKDLQKIERAFEDSLNNVRTQHQNDINTIRQDVKQLHEQVNNLNQSITDQKNFANELFKNCNANIKEMEDDIAVKRFQAEKLNRVKNEVGAAESLIEGAPQSAIGNLTKARLDLMEIREEAQISQAIFDNLLKQSLSGIEILKKKIENNRSNTVVGKTKVELDFWTNGKYPEFEKKVTALDKKIAKAHQDASINSEAMGEIIQEISMLEVEEEQLVIAAVRNIQLSQNRVEIADSIIEELKGKGNFIIQEDGEGYVVNDFREGYFATLVDGGNQEISITVMVDSVLDEEGNSIKNRVSCQRNDKTNISPALLKEQRDLIEKILKGDDENTEVKSIDVPDRKVFDAGALRNAGLTNEQKKALGMG